MKLLLNGEPRDVECSRDVAALVDELGLPSTALLVEHNGVALRKQEWPKTLLAEGDRIEMIRIVAGG